MDPIQHEPWYYDVDNDDEDDVPGYFAYPDPVLCADCGRGTTSGYGCEQCGKALCLMCSEMGANFCRNHPDGTYAPELPF